MQLFVFYLCLLVFANVVVPVLFSIFIFILRPFTCIQSHNASLHLFLSLQLFVLSIFVISHYAQIAAALHSSAFREKKFMIARVFSFRILNLSKFIKKNMKIIKKKSDWLASYSSNTAACNSYCHLSWHHHLSFWNL